MAYIVTRDMRLHEAEQRKLVRQQLSPSHASSVSSASAAAALSAHVSLAARDLAKQVCLSSFWSTIIAPAARECARACLRACAHVRTRSPAARARLATDCVARVRTHARTGNGQAAWGSRCGACQSLGRVFAHVPLTRSRQLQDEKDARPTHLPSSAAGRSLPCTCWSTVACVGGWGGDALWYVRHVCLFV